MNIAHDNDMNLLFIIVIIVLVFLIIQIEFKVKLNYNIEKNLGNIYITFCGISIVNSLFSLHKGYIKIKRKKRIKYLPLVFSKEGVRQVGALEEFIFSKLYLKKMSIYVNIGIMNQACETAIIGGLFAILSSVFATFLKNCKSEIIENIKIFNNFEKTIFFINIKTKASISIIDLIWCLIENIAYKKIYSNSRQKFEQTTK